MSESEEEILFEKDSFICSVKEARQTPGVNGNGFSYPTHQLHGMQRRNDSSSIRNKSMNVISWHLFLCHAALFTFGLCVSVIGPTLLSTQFRSFSTSIVRLLSIVTYSAGGIFVGIVIGDAASRRFNVFCILTLSTLLCAVSTLLVNWGSYSSYVRLIFVIQGTALGLIERGVHHIFCACWRQNHRVYLLLYFSMALGCVVSPVFTSSLLLETGPPVDLFLSKEISSYSRNQSTAPHLLRKRFVNLENYTSFYDENATTLLRNNGTVIMENTESALVLKKSLLKALKVTKPLISDATNIEPPHLRADDNKPIKVSPVSHPKSLLNATKSLNGTALPVGNATTMPLFQNNSSIEAVRKKASEFNAPVATSSSPLFSSSAALNSTFAPTSIAQTKSEVTTGTTSNSLRFDTENGTTNSQSFDSPSINITYNEIEPLFPTDYASSSPQADSAESFNSSSTSILNNSSSPSVIGRLWSTVLEGRGLIENLLIDTDYVYILISICAFGLFLLFGVTCCCFASTFGILRGKFTGHTSAPTSVKAELTLKHVCCKKSTYCSVMVLAGSLCWFIAGFESLLANGLVFYFLNDQKNIGLLSTITFWCGVSLSRLACAVWYKRFWRTNYLLVCFALCFSILGALLVFVDAHSSPGILCFAFSCVGIATGFLSPNLFCWFSDCLSPGPWFHTFWLLAEQLGRAAVPPFVAYFIGICSDHACSHQSAIPIFGLILIAFACILTVFGRKIVAKKGLLNDSLEQEHMSANSTAIRRIMGPEGQIIEYRRQLNENEQNLEHEDIVCFGDEIND